MKAETLFKALAALDAVLNEDQEKLILSPSLFKTVVHARGQLQSALMAADLEVEVTA